MVVRTTQLVALSFTIIRPSSGLAETLPQAVASAFENNAALAEAEAKQKSLEEQVPIARAAGRPTLSLSAQLLHNYEPLVDSFDNPLKTGVSNVNLGIPLFNGGTVKHSIRAAKWSALGGLDSLSSTKAELVINVVSAYVELLAARRRLGIDRAYLDELGQSLISTNIRFAAGELTRTDINQVKTALASAQVAYLNSAAGVRAAEAQFAYYVGHEPADLAPPPPLPAMPVSEVEAVRAALDLNPDISSARKGIHVARERTLAAIGAREPRLQAFANGNYTNYLGSAVNIFGPLRQQVHRTGEVGLTVNLPIYQGGGTMAKIHDARDQEIAAQESERDVSESVTSEVRSQYAQFAALTSEMKAAQEQVLTAEDAYRGVKTLNRLGDRNSQDVLNADQAVLSAKAQSIEIEANRYIAAITLLGRIGSLGFASDTGWTICSTPQRTGAPCQSNFHEKAQKNEN